MSFHALDDQTAQRKRRAILASVSVALLLVALKTVTFVITGSVAMLSESLHSLTDLLATGLAFLAIRRSTSAPSELYRYGQGRAENLSALAEGGLVVAAAVAICVEAVLHLLHPHAVAQPFLATAVMAFAAAAYLTLSFFLRREAKSSGSPALEADSRHVLVDVYAATGVAAGLLLVSVTGWRVLDPVIALLVAAFVVFLGLRLAADSLRALLDAALPAAELAIVRDILKRPLPGVTGYHRLRSRRVGADRYVDVHMTFDPDLSIERAHALASEVERQLESRLKGMDVVIHLEPDTEAPEPGLDYGASDRPGDLRPLEGLSGHGYERKFLLAAEPSYRQLLELGAQVDEIEQHYLLSDSGEERVRRRWRPDAESFYWTRKEAGVGLDRELEERAISRVEYADFLLRRDPSRYPIRKTRYSFEYDGNLVEVDVFALPVRLQVLEVEMPAPREQLSLPSWVKIEREVTDDPEFLNAVISSRLAAQQALPRADWLDGLTVGDPVWVSTRSQATDSGGYGVVATRSADSITISLQGQEVVFDSQGHGQASGSELFLERPGEASAAPA